MLSLFTLPYATPYFGHFTGAMRDLLTQPRSVTKNGSISNALASLRSPAAQQNGTARNVGRSLAWQLLTGLSSPGGDGDDHEWPMTAVRRKRRDQPFPSLAWFGSARGRSYFALYSACYILANRLVLGNTGRDSDLGDNVFFQDDLVSVVSNSRKSSGFFFSSV
jgi:hypothetical protein